MYVKIMSASKPWLWYRGMIGETFMVQPSLFGYWVESGPHRKEVILIRDCVVLTVHNGRRDDSMRKVM
jgi:hypothetical protein